MLSLGKNSRRHRVTLRHVGSAVSLAAALVSTAAYADLTISTGASKNIVCTSGVCTPTKMNANLNVTQLQTLLASGNVKVTTVSPKVNFIVINAELSWASSYALTIDSYESIKVNNSVAVDGTGGLSLVTNDGGAGGILSFGPNGDATFLSTANNLTINGNAYTLVNNIETLASDIAADAGGYYALASSYNATPDGTYERSPVQTTFSGVFEGLGNTITHLMIVSEENATYAQLGLFSVLTGTIENLRLSAVSNTGGPDSTSGGLVATNYGTLFDDSVVGTIAGVKGRSSLILGGLVGVNLGSITRCYTEGSVTNGPLVGGLVGQNGGAGPAVAGTIIGSYSTSSVKATGHASAGGLVGYDFLGTISNSYALGSVTAKSMSVLGGLIGFAGYSEPGIEPNVNSSYAAGKVTDYRDRSWAGGLIGSVGAGGSVIANTYWDTTTSGITNPSQGVGSISNESGITGLSTTQLQAGLPIGFSSSIWAESSSINGGLPYLVALPPPA